MNDGPMPGGGGSLRARQVEQTYTALLDAGRSLFAEHGFAATSVSDVAAAAEVTKGALYHHFATKEALFAAVFEQVEAELQQRSRTAARSATTMLARLQRGFDAYLDAVLEPALGRIVLLDGPSTLGVTRYHELARRYSYDDVVHTLKSGMPKIGAAEVDALATMLLGALTHGALQVAGSSDPESTRRSVGRAVRRLLAGLDGAAD